MLKYVCFDPGVINDDGVIRLYYGTQYDYEERIYWEPDAPKDFRKAFESHEEVIRLEQEMFHKSREEILNTQESVMGPVHAVLEDDMLTVKEEARHMIPYRVKGTDFEEHPFFEASSIRKIGGIYYFIYSSQQNHELCYATSRYPDRDFKFGGTIVSNGDVGINGREEADRLNMTGTTHGSIEKINGQWYVFYHRLTHKSDYSRQACAEKITIAPDGSIAQVEITSCGLNDGALKAEGIYPAVIACHLTNGHMPHGSNKIFTESFPNCTHQGEDRFIGEIADGTLIRYKYFNISDGARISFGITFRSDGRGVLEIYLEDTSDQNAQTENGPCGIMEIVPVKGWTRRSVTLTATDGIYALALKYKGNGQMELKEISWQE